MTMPHGHPQQPFGCVTGQGANRGGLERSRSAILLQRLPRTVDGRVIALAPLRRKDLRLGLVERFIMVLEC